MNLLLGLHRKFSRSAFYTKSVLALRAYVSLTFVLYKFALTGAPLRFFQDLLQDIVNSRQSQYSPSFDYQAEDQCLKLSALIDSNLPRAINAIKNLIRKNPDSICVNFTAANAFYLDGQYNVAINKYFAQGLILKDKKAKESGLNLFKIRLLTDNSWGFSIGHISHLDFLIKLSVLGLLSEEERIVYAKKPSNTCYLSYFKKYISVISPEDSRYSHRTFEAFGDEVSEHISALKLLSGFVDLYTAWNLAEKTWNSRQLPPLLKITERDNDHGLKILDEWNIPSNAWFVALHVREGDARVTRSGSNADIKSYIPAINAIAQRGGYVIRMGHRGMTPLASVNNFIDYANSEFKSEQMDVFLWATCRFFVGSSSGPLSVPPTFGRPVLYTNCPCIGINPFLKNSIMIPKLYFSHSYNRYLSFREMLESKSGWTVSSLLNDIDCTMVDNSPEDISDAVIEMLELKEGKATQLSNSQSAFDELRGEYGPTGKCTIANSFIKKYHYLLE